MYYKEPVSIKVYPSNREDIKYTLTDGLRDYGHVLYTWSNDKEFHYRIYCDNYHFYTGIDDDRHRLFCLEDYTEKVKKYIESKTNLDFYYHVRRSEKYENGKYSLFGKDYNMKKLYKKTVWYSNSLEEAKEFLMNKCIDKYIAIF